MPNIPPRPPWPLPKYVHPQHEQHQQLHQQRQVSQPNQPQLSNTSAFVPRSASHHNNTPSYTGHASRSVSFPMATPSTMMAPNYSAPPSYFALGAHQWSATHASPNRPVTPSPVDLRAEPPLARTQIFVQHRGVDVAIRLDIEKRVTVSTSFHTQRLMPSPSPKDR